MTSAMDSPFSQSSLPARRNQIVATNSDMLSNVYPYQRSLRASLVLLNGLIR